MWQGMKFNFAVFMGYSLEIHGIFIKIWFIVVAFNKPWKNSHAHSDMPKTVHMHVKNFTCIASIMHVKFEVHMHDKIVSHVWKDFTCNKMHGEQVHTYDKNFSHVLQNFTRMSKSSHACEMLMWWTCIVANIDFTWFFFFIHFSHPFHMIFTSWGWIHHH